MRAGAYAGFLILWQGKRRPGSAKRGRADWPCNQIEAQVVPIPPPPGWLNAWGSGLERAVNPSLDSVTEAFSRKMTILSLYSWKPSDGFFCMRLFWGKKAQADGANPEMERLVALLAHHQVKTVFDVGANVGQYAQGLRKAGFVGRIVSFEPLRSNHQLLEKLAATDPKWEIAPRMAVGHRDGETLIHVSVSNDMSSILPVAEVMLEALPKARIVETETVLLNKIDSIFSRFVDPGQNVFVKVDTQGFEMPVLEGAIEAMGQGRILGWQLELSMIPLYSGEKTYEEIICHLKTQGFLMHFIIPGYFSKKLMRQLQIDGVFFKE